MWMRANCWSSNQVIKLQQQQNKKRKKEKWKLSLWIYPLIFIILDFKTKNFKHTNTEAHIPLAFRAVVKPILFP